MATLSDAEVALAFDGVTCFACDGIKGRGFAFCSTCTAALPLPMRWPLADRKPDAFRAAARHLELNPTRVQRFRGPQGEWPYRSVEDLEKAGYKFSGYGQCPSVRCLQGVMFFWTPDRKARIRVNYDYQPHKATCRDPEYFERRRALQASARRRKRA